MSTACRKGDRSEERHVKARKEYRCEWCGTPIPAGSDHVVATEFPGGDAGYATAAGHPVRMRIHGEPPCHYHGEGGPGESEGDGDICRAPGYNGVHAAVGAGAVGSGPHVCHGCGAVFNA